MIESIGILLLGLLVGCSSIPGGRNSHTLYTHNIVLSRQHPQDDFLKVRLVEIADDGATTIEVVPSGGTLRATPGECFVSNAYGADGLRPISASAEKHEARLLRTWCETK